MSAWRTYCRSSSRRSTAGLQLPGYKAASPEELGLTWDLTLRRLEAIPGVQGVAAADWLPVTPGAGPWNTLARPGSGEGEARGQAPGRRKFVSRDYFRALGIPLVAGRAFQSSDGPGSEPVMILSETLATTLFPGEDPLGQPIILWGQPFQVVGVSARVDEAGLGDEQGPRGVGIGGPELQRLGLDLRLIGPMGGARSRFLLLASRQAGPRPAAVEDVQAGHRHQGVALSVGAEEAIVIERVLREEPDFREDLAALGYIH